PEPGAGGARAHAAGARDRRAAAASRPRLPVPADRARPARRPADEMGHPPGGQRVNASDPPPAGATFWVGAAAGAALIAFGIYGMLSTQELNRIVNWALYAGGAIALHDALLVPIALAVGWPLVPWGPAGARPVLAACSA